MPQKCCVPFCKSNYASTKEYVSTFRFPAEFSKRQLWLTRIGRKNFTPSKQASVCIKHFEERFILRDRRRVREDKSVFIEPRKNVLLRYDAYPTIFNFKSSPSHIDNESSDSEPGKHSELSDNANFSFEAPSSKLVNIQSSESEGEQKLNEGHGSTFNFKASTSAFVDDYSSEHENEEVEFEENSKHWINEEDKISDFTDFKLHYQSRLPSNWITLLSGADIYIAKVTLKNTPQLLVTVKIYDDLTFNVWYKNALAESREFHWLFGKRLKLESWTKFECLIQHLNKTDCSSLDLQLKGIQKTLEDCATKCSDKKMLTKLLIVAEHVKFLSFSLPSSHNENSTEDFKPSTSACKVPNAHYENYEEPVQSSVIEKNPSASIENYIRKVKSSTSKQTVASNKSNHLKFGPKRKARKTMMRVIDVGHEMLNSFGS